jgi:hypothetical protein
MANQRLIHLSYKIALVLTSVLISISAALMNKYPLLFPDSNGYIYAGFTEILSLDHPHTYSLFIKLTSMKLSLWFVILLQGLIIVYVLYNFFSALQVKKHLELTFIASVFLSFTTGFSTYCGQVMPDIFTPVCALCLPILLLDKRLDILSKIILTLIFILASMMHVSHVMMNLLVLGIFTLTYFILIKRKFFAISARRFVFCWIIILLPLLTIPSLNYLINGEFYTTKTAHTFFMGRLAENGILDLFLKENCDKYNYKLCQFAGSIPTSTGEFLWNSNSPVYKTDGWYDRDGEYKMIIQKTFLESRYLSLHIQESLKATAKQFFNFEAGDGLSNKENEHFRKYFPFEYNSFLISDQNYGLLNFKELNERQHFILAISAIALGFMIWLPSLNQLLSSFQSGAILFIILYLIANAFICGTLSGVFWRYQGRIIWILPLLCIGLIGANWAQIKVLVKNQIKLKEEDE